MNYLSPPKTGFFTDIGIVEDAPLNEEGSNELKSCEVAAVSHFNRGK